MIRRRRIAGTDETAVTTTEPTIAAIYSSSRQQYSKMAGRTRAGVRRQHQDGEYQEQEYQEHEHQERTGQQEIMNLSLSLSSSSSRRRRRQSANGADANSKGKTATVTQASTRTNTIKNVNVDTIRKVDANTTMNADAIDISDAAPSTPTPLSPPPPTSQSLLFTTSPLSDLGLKSTSTVSSTSVSSATTTNKPTTATTTTVTASTIVVDNDEDFASLKFHRGVLPEPTLVDYESQPTNSPQISKLNPDPDLESISSLANNTGRASLTLEVDNLVKIQNLICTDIDNSNDNPSSKRQKLSPSLPHKPPPTPPSATLESIDGLTTTATSPSSIRPNNANNHYSLLMSLLPTADGANTQFSEFLDNTRALPSFPAQQRPRPPSMPEIRFPPLFSDNQQCQLSVDSTHEDNSDDHYQFSQVGLFDEMANNTSIICSENNNKATKETQTKNFEPSEFSNPSNPPLSHYYRYRNQPASKSTYTPYRPPTSRGAHNPAIRCLLCGGLRHEFFESCERGSLESIQIIYDMYDNLIRCDDCTTNEDEKMVLRDVWTGECTAGTKCKREAHVTDSNDVAAAFTVEAVKIRMWRLVHLDRVLTRAEREMDEIGMAHPYPNRVRMSDLMKRRTARKTTATAVDEFVIEIL